MYFKRLKDLRVDNDYLQKDIANLLGITQQYYSRYELGHYTIPLEHVMKLAKFYNVRNGAQTRGLHRNFNLFFSFLLLSFFEEEFFSTQLLPDFSC